MIYKPFNPADVPGSVEATLSPEASPQVSSALLGSFLMSIWNLPELPSLFMSRKYLKASSLWSSFSCVPSSLTHLKCSFIVVKYYPSMCKLLGSNPNPQKEMKVFTVFLLYDHESKRHFDPYLHRLWTLAWPCKQTQLSMGCVACDTVTLGLGERCNTPRGGVVTSLETSQKGDMWMRIKVEVCGGRKGPNSSPGKHKEGKSIGHMQESAMSDARKRA